MKGSSNLKLHWKSFSTMKNLMNSKKKKAENFYSKERGISSTFK